MSNDELKKKLMQEEMMTASEDEMRNSAKGFYTMYRTFKEAGFTPNQSFALVKAMIVASISGKNSESRP